MMREARKTARSGFTLIEMLVVMAIISILVAMIVTVVMNVRRNAQIARTVATIKVIQSAMNSYKAEYLAYPPIYVDWAYEPDPDMDGSGATSLTSPSYLARNELLYAWLTTRFEGFGKAGATGPFLLEKDINDKDDTTDAWSAGRQEFTDAWGVPLVFVMPGLDHSLEVDEEGNRVAAQNNTMLKLASGAGEWDHENPKFDLYSVGPNGTDETGCVLGTLTTFTKNGGDWGYTCSDYDPSVGVGDDIGNWKQANKKSRAN